MLAALLLSVLNAAAPPWLNGESRAEDLVVSLVTFGPGDDLVSWTGHAALVVEDRQQRQQRLYNYGAYLAGEGTFLNYLKGTVQIFVADTDAVNGTYDAYRAHDRDVRVQELNLSGEQRLSIAKALAVNALPENRNYPYHHLHDNCSTRPRDIIDRALGGQLKAATQVPARITHREQARLYTSVNPFGSLLLDYLQNDDLDRAVTEWDEAWLPDKLEQQLDALRVKGPDGALVPAVKLKWKSYLNKGRRKIPTEPPDWIPALLAIGLGLGGLGFALGRFEHAGRLRVRQAWGAFNALVGLGWGSLGVVLLAAALFTGQTVTYRNENLFLVNPLTFALFPLGVMRALGSERARAGLRWAWSALALTALAGIALKVLPAFDQQNWNLIALIAPLSVATAVSTVTTRMRAPSPTSAVAAGTSPQ